MAAMYGSEVARRLSPKELPALDVVGVEYGGRIPETPKGATAKHADFQIRYGEISVRSTGPFVTGR
jgi:hypothetical protein